MEINLIYSFNIKDCHNNGYEPFVIINYITQLSRYFNLFKKNDILFYMTSFSINNFVQNKDKFSSMLNLYISKND